MLMGVTLLVMLIICGLIFRIAERSVSSFENFILESKLQETTSATNSLLKDTDALISQMYSELSDTTLTRLRLFYESSLMNYSYLEHSTIVQKQLNAIESASDLAEQIEIYLTDYQREISSASVMRYDEETAEWLEKVLLERRSNIFLDENELLFLVSKNAGDTLSRQSIAMVSRISQTGMMRYLQKYAPEGSDSTIILYSQMEDCAEYFAASVYNIQYDFRNQIGKILQKSRKGNIQHTFEGIDYLITWEQVNGLPLTLCQITPMNMLTTQLQEYRQTILAMYALAVCLMFGLTGFLYCTIFRPIQRMKQGLQRVEEGDLSVRIAPTWSREFQQIFRQFNSMAERLQYLIDQEYKLKLLNAKAELKQLHHQISPHFLYNAYFNMRAMLVDEEYDQAALMADLIGRYLRYITVSVQDEATLREELDHSIAYLEIMKLRFGNHLETRVQDCPHCVENIIIPRILIQPLIENAFDHGIRDMTEKGIIQVSILAEGDALIIRVDDNGQSASDEMIAALQEKLLAGDFDAGSDSVALINIHRRISLLYPQGSGLFVSRSPLGGFRSEIRMLGVL